jgi:hypothetical protein
VQWFRLYNDIVDNHKIRMLAFEDRWHFIAIMACHSQELGGGDEFFERSLAIKLGVQLRELEEIQRRLMDVNLIDINWVPIGWDDRQFLSDTSKERVKKYREKRKQNNLSSGQGGYEKHRAALMQRDDSRCVYCGSDQNLCIDHMVPIALGGTDHIDNLAISCKACNSGKSGRTPEQAGLKILSKQALEAMSRYVTVTVTVQDTDTDTDTEQKKEKNILKKESHSETKIILARVAALGIEKDLWDEYLKTRKRLKATNTPRGLRTLLGRIEKFVSQGRDATSMIEEANAQGWKTVYEPKGDTNVSKSALAILNHTDW